jgi:hypothetical protein
VDLPLFGCDLLEVAFLFSPVQTYPGCWRADAAEAEQGDFRPLFLVHGIPPGCHDWPTPLSFANFC